MKSQTECWFAKMVYNLINVYGLIIISHITRHKT